MRSVGYVLLLSPRAYPSPVYVVRYTVVSNTRQSRRFAQFATTPVAQIGPLRPALCRPTTRHYVVRQAYNAMRPQRLSPNAYAMPTARVCSIRRREKRFVHH